MSFQTYWSYRQLLWEEKFGPRSRAAEIQAREEEDRLAAQYRKTVAALRREEP